MDQLLVGLTSGPLCLKWCSRGLSDFGTVAWSYVYMIARNERPARKNAGSPFADYPGVVALRLPNLGLCGGADLGSDHLARHYQVRASVADAGDLLSGV